MKQFPRYVWLICPQCENPFPVRACWQTRRTCCSRPCKDAYTRANHAKRFWHFVDKKGEDECWEWIGSRRLGKRENYGRFFISKGKAIGAHRFSYEMAHSPIPEGKQVLHHCDNPPCVNPKHLWLGTQEDNMRDRSEKRRDPAFLHNYRGTRNPNSRVSEEDAEKMREMYAQGMKCKEISLHFPVCYATVLRHVKPT